MSAATFTRTSYRVYWIQTREHWEVEIIVRVRRSYAVQL